MPSQGERENGADGGWGAADGCGTVKWDFSPESERNYG